MRTDTRGRRCLRVLLYIVLPLLFFGVMTCPALGGGFPPYALICEDFATIPTGYETDKSICADCRCNFDACLLGLDTSFVGIFVLHRGNHIDNLLLVDDVLSRFATK